MNQRDAAFIAHLDAIEGRIVTHLMRIEDRLDRMHEDIAGVKIDLATHDHEDEP